MCACMCMHVYLCMCIHNGTCMDFQEHACACMCTCIGESPCLHTQLVEVTCMHMHRDNCGCKSTCMFVQYYTQLPCTSCMCIHTCGSMVEYGLSLHACSHECSHTGALFCTCIMPCRHVHHPLSPACKSMALLATAKFSWCDL